MTEGKTLGQAVVVYEPAVRDDDPERPLAGVALDRFVPSRWQPRRVFNAESLEDLANDIHTHGVLTPPLVWINEDGEYELIAGERRIRACYAVALFRGGNPQVFEWWVRQLAEKGFVAFRDKIAEAMRHPNNLVYSNAVLCRLMSGPANQLHELALVDNLQREDLSPLEEAHALQDLVQEYGYSQRVLAERLGKSQTWISQRLILLNLAPEVAELVLSGEVEASVARDIARVPQGQQAAVASHIKKHDMKQKAAANFVARLLEFADPDAWPKIAGADLRRYGLVVQEFLRRTEPEERVGLILTRLATDLSEGRIRQPADTFAFDELLAALGITGSRYHGIDEAWSRLFGKPQPPAVTTVRVPNPVDAAPLPAAATNAAEPSGPGAQDYPVSSVAVAPTCATCVINPYRDLVHQVTQRCEEIHQTPTMLWPRCAPGETTCTVHTPEGTPVMLDLPRISLQGGDSQIAPTDPERARLITQKNSYGYETAFAGDVETWATLMLRRVAVERKRVVQREESKKTGVANALRRYVAEQARLTVSHVYSQPCTRCTFYESQDERCRLIRQPPQDDVWSSGRPIAALWLRGDKDVTTAPLIGRCSLFRLADLGILPRVQGARIEAPKALIMALLHTLSKVAYGGELNLPRWLAVQRKAPFEGPNWGESEPYLKKALVDLDGSQLMSLLAAWIDRLPMDAQNGALNAFDPHLAKEIGWTRVRVFRTDDPLIEEPSKLDQPLVAVLAGEPGVGGVPAL